MTNRIICCVCSILAISVLLSVLKRWQTITTRFRRRASHSEIATNDESCCKGSLKSVILDVRKPREEKAMEIKIPGVRKLKREDRPKNRAGLLSLTISQQATQSGMITMLGLLKRGKLTHRWVIERCNPLSLLGERHASPNQVSFTRRLSTMEQRNPL